METRKKLQFVVEHSQVINLTISDLFHNAEFKKPHGLKHPELIKASAFSEVHCIPNKQYISSEQHRGS